MQTSHLFLCLIFRLGLVIAWVPFIYTCVLSECSIGVEVPVVAVMVAFLFLLSVQTVQKTDCLLDLQ